MNDGSADDGNEQRVNRRKDGRRSLLVYMQPEMIKALKRAAVDDDTTVFAMVEEAVGAWLETRSRRKQ